MTKPITHAPDCAIALNQRRDAGTPRKSAGVHAASNLKEQIAQILKERM